MRPQAYLFTFKEVHPASEVATAAAGTTMCESLADAASSEGSSTSTLGVRTSSATRRPGTSRTSTQSGRLSGNMSNRDGRSALDFALRLLLPAVLLLHSESALTVAAVRASSPECKACRNFKWQT